jgi:hypothetical protein
MENRGASVIVLVFIVASGKLYMGIEGLSTAGKIDHLITGVDSQDVAAN